MLRNQMTTIFTILQLRIPQATIVIPIVIIMTIIIVTTIAMAVATMIGHKASVISIKNHIGLTKLPGK